ncbi:hypothetical protein FGE05_27660 [Pseudomonas sp. ICMP22404]|nr:hypothetical protein FGE05_27660 [Pseudomonas sp. ICMP22404]
MGAGLLAKAAGQPASRLNGPPLSRASQAPTGSGVVHKSCIHRKPTVGAGLLARASDLPASMLIGPPLSRAGSLPQGPGWYTNPASTENPLWERACSRRRRTCLLPC